MPSAVTPQRRMRDDDSDNESENGSVDTINERAAFRTSKKSRLNLNGDASPSQRPLLPDGYLSQANGRYTPESSRSEGTAMPYQPGSIVRVKLINFVTYTAVEFFPGPSLNMVIGPNGTGKSTLVCAICLGLGWGPQHLGRAKEVSEFVKHGSQEAHIEIELQGRPSKRNPVLRCVIKREGNKSNYYIDGQPSNKKKVVELSRSFAIQIDNLCQFLPQDKVVEFAAMTPIELLRSTQRAVASQEMLDWHEMLKELRSNQRTVQAQTAVDLETLTNLEGRQRMQEADVERMREREAIKERVKMLELARPLLEFLDIKAKHQDMRKQRTAVFNSLQALEREVEPTLQAANAKEQYRDKLRRFALNRSRAVETADLKATEFSKKVNSCQDRVQQTDKEKESEAKSIKMNKADSKRLEDIIKRLQKQLEASPVEFDVASFNEQIRDKERELRELVEKGSKTKADTRALDQQRLERQRRITRAQEELAKLESRAGQQYQKLERKSRDTARAWAWIQEHQHEFKNHVYGPPIVECSVKDPAYVNIVESCFGESDLLTFTVQSQDDFNKLHRQLHREMRLSEINITEMAGTMNDFPPPVSEQEMHRYGFDGWVLDYITGPEVVLAALCAGGPKLNSTGVALHDTTEEQYQQLQNSPISRWISQKSINRIVRRREYGPSAVTTAVHDIKQARYWTDQPVDMTARRGLQENIDGWSEEVEAMSAGIADMRSQLVRNQNECTDIHQARKSLEDEKQQKQAEVKAFKELPERLIQQEEKLASLQNIQAGVRDRIQALDDRQDATTLEKGQAALAYANAVEVLRKAHDDSFEAELMLIEATSDYEVLSELNSTVKQQLEEKRQEAEQIASLVTEYATKARQLMAKVQEFNAGLAEEVREEYLRISESMKAEELDNEIESEKARLELMHEGNGGIIREYEERQKKIDALRTRIAEVEAALDELNEKIKEIRDKWEPQLDKLIQRISDSFAFNMKQINCAGEVSVYKDDDFDQWAIQIQVKFREHEPLTILDSHRQSGGERAVSTIFYLMSLQSLTRSPFRVVDEINQGMDPRNERLVHARMVSIATGNDEQQFQQDEEDNDADGNGEGERSAGGGSQYFLITPKLLHNLRYERGMRVLCIASGEYMPKDQACVDFRACVDIKRGIVAAMG
ncbi:Structural maintenance of chromosomes protein 5 [Lambiella insularis]|nr:Structural maintenance of chromosomes protein 5 [Lambiella insularis]